MLFKRLDLSVRLFNNSMITVCNIVSVRFFRLAGDEMALQGVCEIYEIVLFDPLCLPLSG